MGLTWGPGGYSTLHYERCADRVIISDWPRLDFAQSSQSRESHSTNTNSLTLKITCANSFQTFTSLAPCSPTKARQSPSSLGVGGREKALRYIPVIFSF